jgi:hypothetical protein
MDSSPLIQQLAHFLIDQSFLWHVTANFNRDMTNAAGRDKLKVWSAFVDRKLHGRRYYLRSDDSRIFFVAIPEWGSSGMNLHYHLLVRVPPVSMSRFQAVAEATWHSLVKSGSMYIQQIGNADEDLKRVVSYDLKDAYKKNNYEHILFSTEFSSPQRRAG